MTAKWCLTRTEAEHIVDVIEASGDAYAIYLVAEVRELFGMTTRAVETSTGARYIGVPHITPLPQGEQ